MLQETIHIKVIPLHPANQFLYFPGPRAADHRIGQQVEFIADFLI